MYDYYYYTSLWHNYQSTIHLLYISSYVCYIFIYFYKYSVFLQYYSITYVLRRFLVLNYSCNNINVLIRNHTFEDNVYKRFSTRYRNNASLRCNTSFSSIDKIRNSREERIESRIFLLKTRAQLASLSAGNMFFPPRLLKNLRLKKINQQTLTEN